MIGDPHQNDKDQEVIALQQRVADLEAEVDKLKATIHSLATLIKEDIADSIHLMDILTKVKP